VRSFLQFVAFQAVWFAAVLGAARGHAWLGPLALVPYLGWMLAREPRRGALASRWLAAGAVGSALDCAFAALGLLRYPSAPPDWPAWLVPPFIVSLWIAFATLPHVSLAWLAPRPTLAAVLGALGGPLSFAAGVRAGAVDHGESAWVTSAVLALEYALATPLLLHWLAPRLASPRAP
jgi:hypothetical protein